MDLGFNDIQQMLRDTAHDVCAKAQGKISHADGSAARFWAQMGELGWLGASLPEDFGGSGGSLIDSGVVAVELGRAGLFGGFAETVGGASALARHHERLTPFARDLLARVAAGGVQLSIPQTLNADAPWSALPQGGPGGGSGLLIGPRAEEIFVFGPAGGAAPGLFAVPLASCRSEAIATTARSGDLYVDLEGLDPGALSEGALLSDGAAEVWDEVLMSVRCLSGALLCGASRHLVDVAIDYSRVREQFGQVIGSFQAVQHAIVDEFSAVEGAELAIYRALGQLEKAERDEQSVRAGIAFVREAAFTVLMKSYDVLGGVGFMEEHPISIYARGMVPILTSFGTAESCESAVGEQVRQGSWLS